MKAVLAAAPILIAYLGGGSGLPVAEQCAWALGEPTWLSIGWSAVGNGPFKNSNWQNSAPWAVACALRLV